MVQPLLCLEQLRPHCGRNLLKILGKPGKALEKSWGNRFCRNKYYICVGIMSV